MTMRHSLLATSIATVLLTACGGGGGGGSNTRPNIDPPPPPATCQDQTARNFGQPGACIPRYRGPRDNALVSTNVDRAHAQGFTGEGVKIGLLDGAPRTDLEGASTYQGRYTYHGSEFLSPDLAANADTNHGHRMAQHIVGRRAGDFDGGVAPGATLEWLRYCTLDPASPDSAGRCGGQPTAALNFLFNRGVTIVNHSFGAQTRFWEASAADRETFLSIGRAFGQAVQRDMLLVWAGGNTNEASIAFNAGMPFFFPEYRQNFLAVVGVEIGADGRPTTTTGAQCVVAADWCIAAPALASHATGNSFGSSASTAIVSGVAALVSQAFPWMGGRNLQATLLTTATDLGAPGVDPVFGWGFVNAERAVRGPAQFTVDFGANVNRTGTWTFRNDISGAGGLVKDGVGGLRLSGTNTYAGLTDVRGGNLILSGSVSGNVRNAATFTSEGGRIGGNYEALTGSTTQVVVGRGLEVTGAASLAGTLNLLAPTDPQYAIREAERILRAGSIAGQFGNVTVGSDFFYNATLTYNSTDVIANLTRKSAAAKALALGAGASVVAGARQMDGLLDYLWAGNGNADIRTAAFGIAGTASADAAMLSMTSLVGQVHGTVRAAAIEQAQGDAAVLADRAFDLRRSGDGAEAWAQIVGRDGTLKSDGFADADLNSTGLLIGADMPVSDSIRVGAALTSTRGSGDLDGLAGSLDTDRMGIGLYAMAKGERAYASVTVGADRLDVETEREIDLGAAGAGLVSSDRKDRVQHGRIEAGYELASGVVPYAAFGGLRHRQGGFAEVGENASVGAIALTANADSHSVSYAEAGLRLDRATAAGGSWGGLLAGRWTLSGEDVSYRAAFNGALPVEFDAEGQELAGSVVRVGLNYMSPERNGWRWFAEGVAEGNSDGLRDSRLGLGVRKSF
jgi:autotransporter-associated beta strand protein